MTPDSADPLDLTQLAYSDLRSLMTKRKIAFPGLRARPDRAWPFELREAWNHWRGHVAQAAFAELLKNSDLGWDQAVEKVYAVTAPAEEPGRV